MRDLRHGGEKAREAIASLYREFAPALRRAVSRRLPQVDDADEIVQEVFVRVVRKPESYRGEGSVGGWLWQIARKCLADHYRRKERFPSAPLHEDWEQILSEDRAEDGELVDCVRQGLVRFGEVHPERAEALRLAVLEGWSMTELAAHIAREVGATRQFVSQCRKKLAPFIAHCRAYVEPSHGTTGA